MQKDHDKRLEDLRHEQDEDKRCAQLIEINLALVSVFSCLLKFSLLVTSAFSCDNRCEGGGS